MGSTGAQRIQLQPIAYNKNWAFQIDDQTDINDLVKNPIPFVGVGEDMRLAMLFEDGTTQSNYIADTVIDINKLETIQPFVLRSGINNYQAYDDSVRPYVIEYKGKYYLWDGNHRVAKAKLEGQKKINVDISVRKDK